MIGKDVQVLLDPTLLIDKETWIELLQLKENKPEKPYVLAYFLDEPSPKAKRIIGELANGGKEVVFLPYSRNEVWLDRCLDAGPKEFLQILLNADVVCTDSFHGTAFSINFSKEFYCFEREYGQAANQSSRVISLLDSLGMKERFNSQRILSVKCDVAVSKQILNDEREKAINYLRKSFDSV